MSDKLTLEYLGTHWPFGGDLFYRTSTDGQEQARVYVDDIGETWVDVRRIPEGGYFHTERVRAYRSFKNAADIDRDLAADYPVRSVPQHAHRTRQRPL